MRHDDELRSPSWTSRAAGRTVIRMSIKALVADDQSMVRAGLRMLLAEEPDTDYVLEAVHLHRKTVGRRALTGTGR
jgi:hypothetical protein